MSAQEKCLTHEQVRKAVSDLTSKGDRMRRGDYYEGDQERAIRTACADVIDDIAASLESMLEDESSDNENLRGKR